jgi:hypothetical protein
MPPTPPPARQLSSKAKPYHLYCCWRHPSDTYTSYTQNSELTPRFLSIFLSFSVWESHPHHPPSSSQLFPVQIFNDDIYVALLFLIFSAVSFLFLLTDCEGWRSGGGTYTAYIKWGFFGFFFFYVRYSTLLHLPPLRFHCVGGCWDIIQDCCDFGIDSQTL